MVELRAKGGGELVVTPRFWLANRVTTWSVDLLFRVATAGVLSPAGRRRFICSGIEPDELSATLRRVRGVQGWPIAWVQTARRYQAAAGRARERGHARAAAHHQARAAVAYHFAQIFELDDLDRKRQLYQQSVGLLRRVGDEFAPTIEHVEIPWRSTSLPGYLRVAGDGGQRSPLVVFLNGASTAKEETIRWSAPFLERGFATLALDTPGSGEAWERALAEPGQDDIAEAILAFTADHPRLDADRVALLGVSLRGALAIQFAATTGQFAAVIAVTSPFQPAAYFRHLNDIVRRDLAFATGVPGDQLGDYVEEMSLVDVAPRVTAPVLVVGAGNDLVVPPTESLSLYRAAGGEKHLLYYDRANHVAFSHMETWTRAGAAWLAETV